MNLGITRMIDQIIAYNKEFVAQKGYEKYLTSKYPDVASTSTSGWKASRTHRPPSVRLLRPSIPIRWCRRILWFVGLSLIQRQEHWKRLKHSPQ